jgi:protein SCO1/2
MSRKQLLILFAAAAPLVLLLDVQGAMFELVRNLQPTHKSSFIEEAADSINSAESVNRADLLLDQPISETAVSRHSDDFPDVELVDQYGQPHKFRTDLIRDKIFCVALFYTECEGTCPGTIQRMKELRAAMKHEFAAEQLQFIAITLDPANDTPEKLKRYADNLGVSQDDGLAEWLFCTGAEEDIEEIRFALGLYDLDPVLDADRTQHAAVITFGNDPTNRLSALPSGLKSSHLTATFLRVAGMSERQRFAALYSGDHLTATANVSAPTKKCGCCATKNSRATKDSLTASGECCSKTGEEK